MAEIALIIQARMGSSRLHGKVLKSLVSDHVLGTLCLRLAPSKFVCNFIIATTSGVQDDPIHKWGTSKGLSVFRGSENDVLERYFEAVQTLAPKASIVVRICADNPLLNYRVLDQIIQLFMDNDCDYLSNSGLDAELIEDGFVVEVFSRDALTLAHRNATLKSDREHVCTYMKKYLKAKIVQTCPGFSHKLSIDTQEDFAAVLSILIELGDGPEIGIYEVNKFLQQHPEIAMLNSCSLRNTGYLKSLEGERNINKKPKL